MKKHKGHRLGCKKHWGKNGFEIPKENGGDHPGEIAAPLRLNRFTRGLILALATGFGLGLSPFASGTVGTLGGVALFWLMAPPEGTWCTYILYSLLFIWMAVLVASVAEGHFRKKDDGRVVIDEVVGFLVTMLFAPHTWQAVAIGFVLFRIFDVVKPAPARKIQELRGGLGIVADDLVAGAYACVCLHLVLACL
jgi:phosphatidylglycerophosphatase A